MALSRTSDVEPYIRLIESVLDEFGARVWGYKPHRSLLNLVRRLFFRTEEPNPDKPEPRGCDLR